MVKYFGINASKFHKHEEILTAAAARVAFQAKLPRTVRGLTWQGPIEDWKL